MPSATQSLEEEDEQVGFGSHNIYAPNFSLFSALSFFPWQEFFVANGFDGEFPAIIYSDDRGEQLYQEVMGQLDLLAQDPSLHCTLGLTYQSDEQNMGQGLTGLLEVELTTKTLPDFLTFSGQSGTSILPYILKYRMPKATELPTPFAYPLSPPTRDKKATRRLSSPLPLGIK